MRPVYDASRTHGAFGFAAPGRCGRDAHRWIATITGGTPCASVPRSPGSAPKPRPGKRVMGGARHPSADSASSRRWTTLWSPHRRLAPPSVTPAVCGGMSGIRCLDLLGVRPDARVRGSVPHRGRGLGRRPVGHRKFGGRLGQSRSDAPRGSRIRRCRPTAGPETSGSGHASTSRSTVLRHTDTPKQLAMRASARPASTWPAAAGFDRSRSVRRPYRRVSPGSCSAKVRRP